MSYTESQLGIALVLVLMGFALLIFFLLKLRNRQLSKDQKLKAEDLWSSLKDELLTSRLTQKDLIFCTYRDHSLTVISMVVKNNESLAITEVLCPTGARVRTFSIGEESYEVEFLKTWKRSAVLKRKSDQQILATYRQNGWFGLHQFEIQGLGVLSGERPKISGKMLLYYKLESKIIGAAQLISSTQNKGRLAALQSDIPLAVRIFMLVTP